MLVNVPAAHLRWPNDATPSWLSHSRELIAVQQMVTKATRLHAYAYLAETFADSAADTARLLSCLGAVSGAWLQVLPTCPSMFIHDDDWVHALKMRIPYLIHSFGTLTPNEAARAECLTPNSGQRAELCTPKKKSNA